MQFIYHNIDIFLVTLVYPDVEYITALILISEYFHHPSKESPHPLAVTPHCLEELILKLGLVICFFDQKRQYRSFELKIILDFLKAILAPGELGLQSIATKYR